jgi:nicotinate dehydrogenase subunit B
MLLSPQPAITTVVMGDTDRTPDGSGAFDFLGRGTPNIRKAAAYTSKAVGKPVRVQWMRDEDFQRSTQSPAALSDIEIALDARGRIAAYQVDHYMPAMQDDRPVGALLAGLPTMAAPNEKSDFLGSTSIACRIPGSMMASRS